MANGISPTLTIRSSTGVEVWKSGGFKEPYVPDSTFAREESKLCRAIVYSPNGRFLAWANGTTVQICSASNWKVVHKLPRPKAFYLKFSPRSTYLMTWEIYTENPKDEVKEKPNLFLYDVTSGREMFSIIQKRHADWEMHWAADESLFAVMVGGEILFYEVKADTNFPTKPSKRLGGVRNGGVSVSPGQSPPFVAFYVPGTKGAPSMCRLFRYPNLEANQPIASKSFFQADKVEMMWNQKGNGILLLTSTDVDQTGVSYYGKQALHFMTTKGDSYAVQLNTEGSIHAVSWSPRSTEFCVVYGFMPSKATLFNLKCDAVFDFGTGNRNSIYYNEHGNLLVFGGFGNLPGYIEVWDMNQKKLITEHKAPDTTLLEWSPAGDIFLTATTAPRLRMSNGFKIWHHTGALLHETQWPEKQELLEVIWQKYAPGTFKENTIINEKIVGIASKTPQASKQKYVPPGMRNNVSITGGESSIPAARAPIPGLPPGYRSAAQQVKDKKQKNKNKSKDSVANSANNTSSNLPVQNNRPTSAVVNNTSGGQEKKNRPKTAPNPNPETPNGKTTDTTPKRPPQSSGDPEKDKKIKSINKKLKDIKLLKEKNERGEKLEQTQIIKMNSEAELVKELKALKAS
ncbi:eukaryotic translation initiation factor 2A [Toxorhynchites rutilus septentrionalis]|uniref:eukaryotic translation initiation factor 2A n=1 Tax=Toxorhynchites rutilus septentrionalis TaxID=329112 RepID=UPI002479424D|nr:eukaryotic translation initiation factor 2A [Toxorhynchites rutilus septentrionalis]